MRAKLILASLFAVCMLSGCAGLQQFVPPQFVGAAKTVGGSHGCRKKCDAQGLHFVGMVTMGEYSDGCVCATSPEGAAQSAITGAGQATVAVTTQQKNNARKSSTSVAPRRW